jgi:hypothetical protein
MGRPISKILSKESILIFLALVPCNAHEHRVEMWLDRKRSTQATFHNLIEFSKGQSVTFDNFQHAIRLLAWQAT